MVGLTGEFRRRIYCIGSIPESLGDMSCRKGQIKIAIVQFHEQVMTSGHLFVLFAND